MHVPWSAFVYTNSYDYFRQRLNFNSKNSKHSIWPRGIKIMIRLNVYPFCLKNGPNVYWNKSASIISNRTKSARRIQRLQDSKFITFKGHK